MADQKTGVPAGGAMPGEAGPGGTGEITPSGRNTNKPGIGPMGGHTPNFPEEEEAGGKTTTLLTERTDEDEPIFDETDREYLDLPKESDLPIEE